MAEANAAYYATHDPFRDFTTAPEITQVFGELIGLWAAVVWEQLGRPDPVILAELGPGRGTLMRDAMRTVGAVAPGFAAALRLHLVETSPRLRAQQAALLPRASWHDDAGTIPTGPMILVANEFLDALPIRQWVRRGEGWAERHVEAGAAREVFDEEPALATPAGIEEGDVIEVGEAAQAVAAMLAMRLASQGGAALFLDYGPAKSAPGDSLQALHDGRPADPFGSPGESDLTAHVDFQGFATAARGVDVHGPVAQGLFLAALGLFQRTGVLARTQPPARAAALVQSAQRLAEPDRMGGLFKALALCQPGLPIPPGFEP